MGIKRRSRLGIPDFEKDFEKELDKEMLRVSKKAGKLMVKTARTNHRYTNRTGKLTNSIKYTGSLKKQSSYKRNMSLEATKDYAEYVHQGHGTWAPDRFISNAVESTKGKIKSFIQEAIDNTFKRMNKKQRKTR